MSEAQSALDAAGDRWTLTGPLTMDTAAGVLAASRDLALPSSGVVDLQRVDAVDSAGVAVLLAWKRRAGVESAPLSFAHLPAALASLAELYDVGELLHDAAP